LCRLRREMEEPAEPCPCAIGWKVTGSRNWPKVSSSTLRARIGTTPPDSQFCGQRLYLVYEQTPSAEKVARLERLRLAAEDGSKALQEVAERAIAIRENMARLRALRFAKKAREIATENRAATVKKR
jgi:hypothetical protein